MRRAPLLMLLACGGEDPPVAPDGSTVDTPPQLCQPQPAIGQFVRRMGNPRMLAGATFTDGKQDLALANPDVFFDGAKYDVYYGAQHATNVNAPIEHVIRHASSVDRMTWTVDDTPALAAAATGWDSVFVDQPTVIFNPAAPAERRYLMLYAGATAAFPFASATGPHYAIGAAFSADGKTFTRITASESPLRQDGLVLTGTNVYPGSVGAIIGDPDLALVDGVYHVWFSSFACEGASCATVSDRGIAHATSGDGITWTVDAAPVRSLLRASANDTTGGAQPSVLYDAEHCKFELWLSNDLPADLSPQPVTAANTRGVFKAESTDGLSWSINYVARRDMEWNQAAPSDGEHLGLAAGADIAQNTTGRLMLFIGYDDQNVPSGYTLPTSSGPRPGVTTLNVATRDLP